MLEKIAEVWTRLYSRGATKCTSRGQHLDSRWQLLAEHGTGSGEDVAGTSFDKCRGVMGASICHPDEKSPAPGLLALSPCWPRLAKAKALGSSCDSQRCPVSRSALAASFFRLRKANVLGDKALKCGSPSSAARPCQLRLFLPGILC